MRIYIKRAIKSQSKDNATYNFIKYYWLRKLSKNKLLQSVLNFWHPEQLIVLTQLVADLAGGHHMEGYSRYSRGILPSL